MENKTLREKVLYGFGDSLVAGHAIGVGMLHRVAEKYGMDYHCFAINGATIIPNIAREFPDAFLVDDVAAQIAAADKKRPDFICFDGMTNDAYPFVAETRLGRISVLSDGKYDTSTFYGAFERVCYLLKKKYGESRIFYVAAHRMPTRDRKAQEILHKAAEECCAKWEIPVIDIYHSNEFDTCREEMRRAYSYNTAEKLTDGNGTHLNAEGYARWYAPAIERAFLRSLQEDAPFFSNGENA